MARRMLSSPVAAATERAGEPHSTGGASSAHGQDVTARAEDAGRVCGARVPSSGRLSEKEVANLPF
jgi:hypothetical protein